MYIPENITEFLYWVKETTETYWSNRPLIDQYGLSEINWLRDARWIGLNDTEINQIEEKYALQFTADHRQFLNILHTVDRKCVTTDPDHFAENASVLYYERPLFCDWRTNEETMRATLSWPYTTILQDITSPHPKWLRAWGPQPVTRAEREAFLAQWYRQAPKLIPIDGLHFLVSEPLQAGNPVLAVRGVDTMVYGWDLRSFLIEVFEKELDLLEPVIDPEDQEWLWVSKKQSQDIRDQGYAANRIIPFWGELVTYANRGWTYTPGNK